MLKGVSLINGKNAESVKMLSTKEEKSDKCNKNENGKMTIKNKNDIIFMHKSTKKPTFYHTIRTNGYLTICYILV